MFIASERLGVRVSARKGGKAPMASELKSGKTEEQHSALGDLRAEVRDFPENLTWRRQFPLGGRSRPPSLLFQEPHVSNAIKS
jgi:hypothetical protein